MYAIIVQLLTSVSLLPTAIAAESPTAVNDKGDVSFTDFDRKKARAIEKAYVKATQDQAKFDKLASEDYAEFSCWSYPGNIGCWIGDWLVSCEKNANTNDEWDCGVAHHDDLD